jgi:hypothetical protein
MTFQKLSLPLCPCYAENYRSKQCFSNVCARYQKLVTVERMPPTRMLLYRRLLALPYRRLNQAGPESVLNFKSMQMSMKFTRVLTYLGDCHYIDILF